MDRSIGVVRPPSLVQAVADTLKKEILSGEFPEGASLPEVQLSEALKVSRGTVREALRQPKYRLGLRLRRQLVAGEVDAGFQCERLSHVP